MYSQELTRRGLLAGAVGSLGAAAGCLGGSPATEFRDELRAYDPERGEWVWTRADLGEGFGTGPVGSVSGHALLRSREGLLAVSVEDGTEAWSVTGEDVGAPLVDGDRLYLPVGDELRVLDGETGEVRSTLAVPDLDWTEPALSGEELFVRRETDEAVRITALGPDGDRGWDTRLEVPERAANIDPGRPFQLPPIVVGEQRVFVVQGIVLVALDRETGEQRWTYERDNLVGSPAVGDGRVYVAERADEAGTGLVALDAGDGSQLWTGLVGLSARTAPTLYEWLYVGADDVGTAALDPADGRIRWSTEEPPSRTGILVEDGTVLTSVSNSGAYEVPFGLAGDPSYVEARDAGSGERRWSVGIDGFLGWGLVRPRPDRVLLGVGVPVEE